MVAPAAEAAFAADDYCDEIPAHLLYAEEPAVEDKPAEEAKSAKSSKSASDDEADEPDEDDKKSNKEDED